MDRDRCTVRSVVTLCLAQDERADALLAMDPFALLVGMLLDQQVPMERAFAGPRTIADRLGVERLDARQIADADPDSFAAVLSEPPAVHRYPKAMAGRIQKLAQSLLDQHDGDAASVWTGAQDGTDLVKRLESLPGFGKQKARIFAALLGKQLGVTPEGWEQAAAPYGEAGSARSVADVVDEASLGRVREYKRAAKAGAASS